MDGHALIRTSPKGEEFVGRCMRCGQEGLGFIHMDEACANPSGETDAESLLRAIEED